MLIKHLKVYNVLTSAEKMGNLSEKSMIFSLQYCHKKVLGKNRQWLDKDRQALQNGIYICMYVFMYVCHGVKSPGWLPLWILWASLDVPAGLGCQNCNWSVYPGYHSWNEWKCLVGFSGMCISLCMCVRKKKICCFVNASQIFFWSIKGEQSFELSMWINWVLLYF